MTTRAELADLLPALVGVLAEARTAASGDAERAAVARFLDGILTVGRALTEDPELRDEADVALFLQESGSQLTFLHTAVDDYRVTAAHESYGTWEDGGEWERLLERRSSLQFARDLYRGTPYDGYADLLELDELDDVVRDRGRSDGFPPSRPVPTGTPTSHWWWWWPGSPPAS